jgi:IS30 family transposase
MTKYTRITISDREIIYQLQRRGYNQTDIASLMKRHKSTISRELKRCKPDPLGYLPDRANNIASSLYKRNAGKFCCSKRKAFVLEKLNQGWSPEQIAGRLKLEKSNLRVSHETIYKFIYSQEGQSQKLYRLLTRQKPKRRRWHSRKPKKSHIPETASIKYRPQVVENRAKIGHWEGDLVVFSPLKSDNISTLLERKSRYVKLVHNKSKYTKEVVGGIGKVMGQIPAIYKKSVTLDRGTEFASYSNLGVPTFFCNPHSPWQKGSNENFNGRLRRFFPKGRIPTDLTQKRLDEVEDILNNQPRKCLGFKTPHEVFFKSNIIYVALDP